MEGTRYAKHLDGEISQLLALWKINKERIPDLFANVKRPQPKVYYKIILLQFLFNLKHMIQHKRMFKVDTISGTFLLTHLKYTTNFFFKYICNCSQ
jgi:hypothetical protein